MTDRLSTLLHDAASTLDTPSLSATAAMTEGRRLRQRRRARTAVAGAVAAVLVAVGASLTAQQLVGDHAVSPTEQLRDYEQRGAWAVGDQVHVGDHVVELPASVKEPMVTWIGYSSVGALVKYADVAADDPGASERTMLVTASGETRDLGKLRSSTSDPGSPVIVYARATSEPHTWELVALDLASGEEHTVGTPWRSDSPLLGRSGDVVVYVRDQHMVTVNWRTGETGRLPQRSEAEIGMTIMTSFGHGGYLTAPDPNPDQPGPTSTWHVRGLPDGNLIATVPDSGDGQVSMSPDGRFVMTGGNGSVTVFDVASERATPLRLTGTVIDFGWTPDGHVVGATDSHVAVCDPSDGSCSDVGDLGRGERLRVAHGAYDTDPMAGG